MIMTEEIKISQFCFSNPRESNNYAPVYLAEPEKKFLEKFGRLGILINLGFKEKLKKQTLIWAKKWSQNLIDLTKNDFYNPLRTAGEIEKDFEESLQKINNWLQQERSGQPEIFERALVDFDVDIVLLKDDNVYFSQTGDIRTCVLQDDKLVNLVEEKNKSAKFSNIVSGKLENDSLLFFTTKNLFDYFSSQKIIQIFKKSPVSKIEPEIKKFLSEEIGRISLLGLVFSKRKELPEVAEVKEKPEIKEELKLNPSVSKKVASSADRRRGEKQKPEPAKPLIEMKPAKKERFQKIKPGPPDLPIMKTSRLTYSRKSLLIVLIILATLFSLSLVTLGRQQRKNRLEQEYARTLEELRAKQDELSLALIYQDSVKIKGLSNEIKNLLSQLPQKTEEQKQNYSFFQDKYAQQMNKFYRLITLDNLSPLVDLSETYKDVQTGGLANVGNDFYVFDQTNNHIYLFNVETKKLELVNQTSTNVGRLTKLSLLDNDTLIGIDQNQELASFNTIDKKLLPLKLIRETPQKIQDFYVYGRRLYTLEPLKNQIYKHQKTIDGFGTEQSWLQDQTDITDALAFTIDGSVYVLKKTGEISKFYQGKAVEFNLDDIQPVLSLSYPNVRIKMFTNDELNYLYLLDGPGKRLIILSKQGKLIKQFTSSLFEDLKDFVVSRKENKVWLLCGPKIFEIQTE